MKGKKKDASKLEFKVTVPKGFNPKSFNKQMRKLKRSFTNGKGMV